MTQCFGEDVLLRHCGAKELLHKTLRLSTVLIQEWLEKDHTDQSFLWHILLISSVPLGSDFCRQNQGKSLSWAFLIDS